MRINSTTLNVLSRIAVMSFVIAGCTAGPTDDHHIKSVQPGDATLSCDELRQQIAEMDRAVEHLQSDYDNANTTSATSEAIMSSRSQPSYIGQYGPLMSAFESAMN